jgi:hypothetical protein
MLGLNRQAMFSPGAYSRFVSKPKGKHMKKYIVLLMVALLAITCAVLEGLIESLPPQFIQFNGLLTIICAGVFIGWTLKLQAGSLSRS